VSDGYMGSLKLYRKQFPAGKAPLGGNLASPAAGAGRNYVVAVKAGS
jgi:hypothetical protein